MFKKGIIFDLDGTLWDACKETAISWNQVLDDYDDINRNITVKDLHTTMGKTAEEIVKLYFKDISLERGLEILEKAEQQNIKYLFEHGGKLYEDLEETLKELYENYNLYIVSNCQEISYIEAFLEHHKLGKYFEDYECHGRTGLSKGENIELVIKRNNLDKAIYVGDTLSDYEATKIANVPFVYAEYGFGDVNEITYEINAIRELPEVAVEIF